MPDAVAPKATKVKPKSSALYVETDPETHRRFGAACRILGGTIRGTVDQLMRETIARAGLDVPQAR